MPGDPGGIAQLYTSASDYGSAVVEQVQAADERGENRDAAELALSISEEGAGTADAYQAANEIAAANVEREADDLADRFDAAGDADIQPLVPIALGVLAALLAAAGILARGRRYR